MKPKKLPKIVEIEYEINPELVERHGFVFGGKGKKKPKTKKELLRAMKSDMDFHLKQAEYYKQRIKELRKVM